MSPVAAVIRARNAAVDLRRCLLAVAAQRLPGGGRVAAVVVDNASTDGTAGVAAAHGAAVVPIEAGEFTWGRAINRGIAAAGAADVAIVLSADATPCDDGWAEALLRPFADPAVAGVYGRQCPRPDAPVDEVVRLRRAFDDAPRTLTLERIEADLRDKRWVCSNACAAVRVAAWREHPFDEDVPASEELPWVRAVLAAGWRALYEPRAAVYHSHREGIGRSALREWEIHQNSGRSPARLLGALAKRRVRNCAGLAGGVRTSIEGMIRLPFECLAIGAVAASALHPPTYRVVRRVAWGRG